MNAIIHSGKVSSDWQVSSIVNSFKGKNKAIECGNLMKVVKRIADRLIREQVAYNYMICLFGLCGVMVPLILFLQ